MTTIRILSGPNCAKPGCWGPTEKGSTLCFRHMHDRNAPLMKVTCECDQPDIEWLRAFGLNTAQCRQCGSPVEGSV